MTSSLEKFQHWARKYFTMSGIEESKYRIQSLGNQGWMIRLATEDTPLVTLDFPVRDYRKSNEFGVSARCVDAELRLVSDATNLVEALDILCAILETKNPPPAPWTHAPSETSGAASKLQQWYWNSCDGNWEHDYDIQINPLPDPGWSLTIELIATEWEDLELEPITYRASEADWFHVRTTERGIRTTCGPLNLETAINESLAQLTPETMTYP
jgi:Immunity protein 53